jgi:hypothetical protein
LEGLENRVVPTILFEPNATRSIVDLGGPVLTNAHVLLIYWGANWQPGNQQLATNIEAGVDSILNNSPYMSRLAQYRGIGNAARLATFYVTNSSPPPVFTIPDVQAMLVANLNTGFLPNPALDPQFLYYVVTQPGANAAEGYGGYHSFGLYNGVPIHYGIGSIPSTLLNDPARLDFSTVIFSHELVEAVTDPEINGITVFPGGGANELCDNNAQLYTYRLNGYLVQSYWSQFDRAFVVPDGQVQTFLLSDSVNRVLYVTGDQLANLNDVISMDIGVNGGVKATLNGEVADFDPNVFLFGGPTIKSVIVSSGNGTNIVTIEKTLPGVTTTVNMLGGTNDVLNVGHPVNGQLDNILGPVYAYGQANSVNVVFDDQADAFNGETYTITRGTVTRTGGVGFFYFNVRSLTLNVGTGNDTITVASTAANTPTQVNVPQNVPGLLDTLNVGTPGNGVVAGVHNNLNVTAVPATIDVSFNDQGSKRNTRWTVRDGSVTRTGDRAVTYNLGPVHSLAIHTGRHDNVIDFQGINAATPATVDGGIGRTTVRISTNPISTAQVTFTNIQTMDINGGTLNVVNNLAVKTLKLSAGTLTGPGVLTVNGPSTWSGGTMSGAGQTTLAGNAVLTVTGPGVATLNTRSITGTGSVVINGGTVNLVGGAIAVGGGLTIQNGGVLAGNGTLTTNVTNSGEVDPGGIGFAGLITINGALTQTAIGVLNIDIGGVAPNQYDQLVVNGIVTLSGTLKVAFINGFMPAVGNAFTVLTFGGRNGDFQFENGLQLGANRLDPRYDASTLTLVVVPSNIGLVINRAALGANDSVDWGVLGPEETWVNNPFGVISVGGVALMASEAPGQFLRLDEGTTWLGNFSVGDHLLYTGTIFGGGHGPITIHFGAPVIGAGAQIQANYYGAFSARIAAFDAGGNLLGSFAEAGNSAGTEDNSAIFIGIRSMAANIATIAYSLDFGGLDPTDFAINRLDFVTGPSVPDGGAPSVQGAQRWDGLSVPAGRAAVPNGTTAAAWSGLPLTTSGAVPVMVGADSLGKNRGGSFDPFALTEESSETARWDRLQGAPGADAAFDSMTASAASLTLPADQRPGATDQLFLNDATSDPIFS